MEELGVGACAEAAAVARGSSNSSEGENLSDDNDGIVMPESSGVPADAGVGMGTEGVVSVLRTCCAESPAIVSPSQQHEDAGSASDGEESDYLYAYKDEDEANRGSFLALLDVEDGCKPAAKPPPLSVSALPVVVLKKVPCTADEDYDDTLTSITNPNPNDRMLPSADCDYQLAAAMQMQEETFAFASKPPTLVVSPEWDHSMQASRSSNYTDSKDDRKPAPEEVAATTLLLDAEANYCRLLVPLDVEGDRKPAAKPSPPPVAAAAAAARMAVKKSPDTSLMPDSAHQEHDA